MESGCKSCEWHSYVERKPGSLISKLWRWHTKWCPGWKAYQEELAKRGESQGDRDSGSPRKTAVSAIARIAGARAKRPLKETFFSGAARSRPRLLGAVADTLIFIDGFRDWCFNFAGNV